MAMTLDEARRVVSEERRVSVAEREAFGRFRSAVERFDGLATGSDPQSTAAGLRVPAGRTLRAVGASSAGPTTAGSSLEGSYRRTVMAVEVDAAGDCVADESARAHMAAELGPDLAQAVCGGRVTPDVHQALLDRIDVARDARGSFVALLDRESASLARVEERCEEARERLRQARAWESTSAADGVALDRAFEAWDALDAVSRMLDDAADDRQAVLARHRRTLAVVDDDATAYLYGGRPGLATIASAGEGLAAGRRAVTSVVGRRPRTDSD